MQERPDLILMDVGLPDMDGAVALTRLRAATTTAAIPVVAVTALAMKGDRERLLSAGFDDYLSKPVDVDALVKVGLAHTNRRSTRDGAHPRSRRRAAERALTLEKGPPRSRGLPGRRCQLWRRGVGLLCARAARPRPPRRRSSPGHRRLELCRALRSDPATEALPVVMVTAGTDRDKTRGA